MPGYLQQPPIRDDGLQLSEDRSFQSRHWTVQRVAWVGFGFLLLLALAGFSGSGGYFSRQTLELEGATVALPRISRWQTSDHVKLSVQGGPNVEVAFGPTFHDYFTIEQIQPQPETSKATASGLRLRFSLAGNGAKTIHFDVRASRPGWAAFNVSVGSASETTWTAILP